jgi:hypothetical protein
MEQIRYQHGYHEKWEAWLHGLREAARLDGHPLSLAQVSAALTEWTRINHQTANLETPCNVCQEQIAQGLIDGTDPFRCPDEVRVQLEKAGFRIPMRKASGK